MASIINADSGISSSVTGITFSADNSGALNIQTNGVTAIAISASQVVSFPATTTITFGSLNVTNLTVTTASISDLSATVLRASSATVTNLLATSASITTLTNNPTFGAGTANGMLYLNGSKVVTSGSAVVFDGANMGLGVTPSASWRTDATLAVLEVKSAGSAIWNAGARNFNFSNNSYWVTGGSFQYASTGAAAWYQQTGGEHRFFTAPSGTAGNAITFTQAMTLDADGNLGLGSTSPTSLGANVSAISVNSTAANTTGAVVFQNSASQTARIGVLSGWMALQDLGSANGISIDEQSALPIRFVTNANERARITSGGEFVIGDTSAVVANAKLNVKGSNSDWLSASLNTNASPRGTLISHSTDSNGTANWFLYCEGSATERASIRSNGGLANYSANNVNLASDERLKKDISPLATAWGKVKGMEVVNFRYKDCNEGDPLLYGVIAQQVQPIVPELVVVTQEAKEATEDKEATPEYYGIREQPMYWLAIKALQEAMAKIETLEAKVAALETK